MMRHLLVFLLCLPGPLAAQAPVLDAGTVSACFDSTKPGVTEPACIGDAATACQKVTPQGETTLGISECLMAEAGAWDDLLNREYNAARKIIAEEPGLADQLLTAQRAWIAYRDADCNLAYSIWGDGSMRVIAAADCQLRHTARRTFQLRDLQGF